MLAELLEICRLRPLLLLGMGSELHGDDAWAFHLVSFFKKRRIPGLHVLWGSTAPENFLPAIARLNPKAVIICDAGTIPASPGEYALVREENLPEEPLFSHRIPLKKIGEMVRERTGAPVHFLILRPLSLDLLAGLTQPVARGLKSLKQELLDALT